MHSAPTGTENTQKTGPAKKLPVSYNAQYSGKGECFESSKREEPRHVQRQVHPKEQLHFQWKLHELEDHGTTDFKF